MSNNKGNSNYTNALIHESSPYLLQHAHNPVEWHPWSAEILAKAQKEDKPLLISIGYSACHWCHVMEKESFQDIAVAKVMNEHFICIKVDREERPDIDQIYMDAVQLMTKQGGWPLNCFATPKGEPFYGGTYFPKEKWIGIMQQIATLYKEDKNKVLEYAKNLTQGVQKYDLIKKETELQDFQFETLQTPLKRWQAVFDKEKGGNQQAPKFPMPNNYEFLLNYNHLYPSDEIESHLNTTLKKMAYGGIYDQIGGGFARYSVDKEWKVPHFEKMLYDNAQLISLYSLAFQWSRNPIYAEIVKESIAFVNRELKDKNGGYYSALDADSEGVEGKFYVWKKSELMEVLKEDYSIAEAYFNIDEKGFWEGSYILLRDKEDEELCEEFNLSLEQFQSKIKEIKIKLFKVRAQRIRPALDDKIITSWNSLMLKSLCDAYLCLGDANYLTMAIDGAEFLLHNQLREDGGLYRLHKDGKSTINGYLKDYSFTIEAFIALYQCTFDEQWLEKAMNLANYVQTHFYDEESGMFFFTSVKDKPLIARKMEVMDNVIPASNSSLAKGLHHLGILYQKEELMKLSKQMLLNVQQYISNYLPGTSNWGMLMLRYLKPYYEVAIAGENSLEKALQINQSYIPNKITLGQLKQTSQLPLLESKWIEKETFIYVCENKTCQAPVNIVKDAIAQMLG